MVTYLIINLVFLSIILIFLRTQNTYRLKTQWIMLAILLLLTAIFDNVLIYFNIVGYDTSKLLGLYIGLAPIEDFFYSLAAAFLIPAMWSKVGGNNVTNA